MENTHKIFSKEIFRKSFSIYRKNFVLFTLITLINFIPELLNIFGPFPGFDWLYLGVLILIFLPLEFFIVKIAFSTLKDEKLTIQQCIKGALPKLFGLFILKIIVNFIFAFLTLFFIIPSIMFLCSSFFATVIYILEDTTNDLVLDKSSKLTKNFRIDIFKYVFIFIILPYLLTHFDPSLLNTKIDSLSGLVASLTTPRNDLLSTVISYISTFFLTPFLTVITTVLYDKIKTLKKSF